MSPRAFLPSSRELVARNAKAAVLLDRLLDALLLLETEGSSSLGDLGERVGLAPDHLRDLLSAWMVAPADMAGSGQAPFSVVFGTVAGPLDADDDDAAFDEADHVWMDSARAQQVSLLDDVGRRAMTVDEVVAGLLAVRALLAREDLSPSRRPALEGLATRLSEALGASVEPVSGPAVHELSTALARRCRVELRYRDPWSGEPEELTAAVLDLRRIRDRRVVDVATDGPDVFRTLEVSGVESVVAVGHDLAYEVPDLPPREQRHGTIDVVVRVPAGSAQRTRLMRSWEGTEVGADAPAGTVDVRIPVDLPARERIGVLLAQLGPTASLVAPGDLAGAGAAVARRVLEAHGAG